MRKLKEPLLAKLSKLQVGLAKAQMREKIPVGFVPMDIKERKKSKLGDFIGDPRGTHVWFTPIRSFAPQIMYDKATNWNSRYRSCIRVSFESAIPAGTIHIRAMIIESPEAVPPHPT